MRGRRRQCTHHRSWGSGDRGWMADAG
ncbi:hypothetical protein [Candidatus Dormiibacter inghamiae]